MRRVTDDDAKGLAASTSLTRRGLFEFAGLAIAAAALPKEMPAAVSSPDRSNSQQAVSSVMERLSTYLIHLTGNRAIPGLWLSLAAACGFVATLLAKPSPIEAFEEHALNSASAQPG